MTHRILVAGATGVIGRRLVPRLVERGYEVFGTTRSADRAQDLERAGATPVVFDVYDRAGVARVLAATRPRVVIHQLTDLSGGFTPDRYADTLARNTRLRTEGTKNLVDAARAAAAVRLIAQSIVWVYAPGPEPHAEEDALEQPSDPNKATTMKGVIALESAVMNAAPVEGVVLRYGWFYGPGANEKPAGAPGLHVDAAAEAAVLAIDHGVPGIYNVAEEGPHVSIEKARRELGWSPRR
jgi:nucleoside-diphosphate-sugar epimerase